MDNDIETWLIVGLGNPGEEYAGTRHNAGFQSLDALASEIRANYWKNECGSLAAAKERNGQNVILAKPQSFMNLSGTPTSQLMKKHSVAIDHLIVIHDDLDIPSGTIRVKSGGGHGGHNGLRSIIDKLGTKDFTRVKIGIGRPPGRMPVVDYVLQRPRGDQMIEFEEAALQASKAAMQIMDNGVEKAQAAFN